ncbi:hypothetical protein PESP_a1392 [Pseudoalteromonas espejiana DSM 9414]|nr:hypothetical protein PESP_a1392 [Pseudoalteromonas espejiana DSM 9414]
MSIKKGAYAPFLTAFIPVCLIEQSILRMENVFIARQKIYYLVVLNGSFSADSDTYA